jgi:hypothetical protein
MARTRYRLDRIDITPLGSRPAAWTFAGEAVRGIEWSYVAIDRNFASRNNWEFIVRVPADRSLTFAPATRGTARGRWYCPVALADPTGEQSRVVARFDERHRLPAWFKDIGLHKKERVKPTRGTDATALVMLVAPGGHADMIRLFFATKVWVLKEAVVLR